MTRSPLPGCRAGRRAERAGDGPTLIEALTLDCTRFEGHRSGLGVGINSQRGSRINSLELRIGGRAHVRPTTAASVPAVARRLAGDRAYIRWFDAALRRALRHREIDGHHRRWSRRIPGHP